jgi:xylan 1,4-beta-xylosidase
VEAEAKPAAGDLTIIDDAAASGGKAVSSKRDWQPLIYSALPEGTGFNIWARHKGGPIQLKSSSKDGQKELQWVWDQPAEWKWSKLGSYARVDLGDSIMVIRGGNGGPGPQLDAIVFEPAEVKSLPTNVPDEKAAPLTIRASVDWNKISGKMTPLIWGINDYEILDPKGAADPGYQELLRTLKVPLVRIHHAGFSNKWTEVETRTWDVGKVKAGFAASTGFKNSRIMMNVSHWPDWISKEPILTPAQEDEFARLCGQLVRVMRDDVKRPIAYWEMTNEMDNTYEKVGKLDDLWRLFNKIAVEVRKVDPKAKVGGPALTWAKGAWLEGFLENCAQNVDFVTWHNYASGDIFDPNEKVLGAVPNNIAPLAKGALEAVQKYAPGRNLETFLTEYNIKWIWDPIELRHGNNIGAVFDASVLRNMALLGVTGVTKWHAKGHSYGMIEADNEPRSPYYLYYWGIRYLVGDMASAQVSDETSLEVLPIVRADKSRSILFINKANRAVKVPAGLKLLPISAGQKPWAEQINHKGRAVFVIPNTPAGDLELPGYSVTMLTTAAPVK